MITVSLLLEFPENGLPLTDKTKDVDVLVVGIKSIMSYWFPLNSKIYFVYCVVKFLKYETGISRNSRFLVALTV